MKISLVASSNGLGHARRLLNLVPGFVGQRNSLLLYLTPLQAAHLESEIIEIMKIVSFKVLLSGRHGIDGSHFRNYDDFEEVTTDCRKNIAESDLVISDNSIWPASYSNNFFLFGHFNWVSFYKDNFKSKDMTQIFLEEFQKESALLRQCQARFVIREFALSDDLNLRTLDVPLLRYSSDCKVSVPRGSQVWFSRGTTKMNGPNSFREYSKLGQLHVSETWQLCHANELPLCVIGRPGLGTIRDCLAHQTYFHPAWSGVDVELASNESNLKRLGFAIGALQDSARIRFEIKEIGNRIGEFWLERSASPQEVVDLILSSVR